MVYFRVCLSLHNFLDAKENKITKNETKAQNIINFYKLLGKKVAFLYNLDIKTTTKYMNDYYEPLIKLRKNILVYKEANDQENEALTDIVKKLFPPSIEIDFEFIMNKENEQLAIKEFKKSIRKHMKKEERVTTYKELRRLYYSTKITNFVKNLNSLITTDQLWNIHKEKYNIKTKYSPHIHVEDTTILSLR